MKQIQNFQKIVGLALLIQFIFSIIILIISCTIENNLKELKVPSNRRLFFRLVELNFQIVPDLAGISFVSALFLLLLYSYSFRKQYTNQFYIRIKIIKFINDNEDDLEKIKLIEYNKNNNKPNNSSIILENVFIYFIYGFSMASIIYFLWNSKLEYQYIFEYLANNNLNAVKSKLEVQKDQTETIFRLTIAQLALQPLYTYYQFNRHSYEY